jgi:toxin CcdB
MARFDLYGNPDDGTRRLAAYLLDVQSTHVGTLPTRIVIPLRPTLDLGFSGKPSDLLPVFEIAGKKHFLDTPAMSAIPLNALGSRISSLADHRDAILAALDRIFSAY